MTGEDLHIGDSDDTPTLQTIVDRLPDGSDLDDGLESPDGTVTGGYVSLHPILIRPDLGVVLGTLTVTDEDDRILRRFQVTLTELPRVPRS